MNRQKIVNCSSLITEERDRVASPHTATFNIHPFISYVERLMVEFSQHGEEATFLAGSCRPLQALKLYHRTNRSQPQDRMEIFPNWFVVMLAQVFKTTEIQ